MLPSGLLATEEILIRAENRSRSLFHASHQDSIRGLGIRHVRLRGGAPSMDESPRHGNYARV